MTIRRWLASIAVVVAAAVACTLFALPEVVRQLAAARIQAITGRPTSIDRVQIGLLSGHITVHGFRLAERGGAAPFADFERSDTRLHLRALLSGHLWIRELALRNSTVRGALPRD
jgi:hypothetical protein